MLNEELVILNKVQKYLKESYQNIGDAMISGGIDNMEKYKYMMGQAHAYLKISQEISNLLKPKEPKMILKENTTKPTLSNSDQKTKPALLDKYDEIDQKEIDGYERIKTKESDKLPRPTGWRLVVLPFKMKEKTKGGLILGQETLERQQIGSTCGLVLAMGPHCYDKEKFPEGPWCKKGDWVIFARYAGSRIQIDGGEVRMLNDDEVLATIDNPEDILHQY
jgi:chaperonin GroES